VCPTTRAKLSPLYALRMLTTVFGREVIPLFAVGALEYDFVSRHRRSVGGMLTSPLIRAMHASVEATHAPPGYS
jgi:hypothetical protein